MSSFIDDEVLCVDIRSSDENITSGSEKTDSFVDDEEEAEFNREDYNILSDGDGNNLPDQLVKPGAAATVKIGRVVNWLPARQERLKAEGKVVKKDQTIQVHPDDYHDLLFYREANLGRYVPDYVPKQDKMTRKEQMEDKRKFLRNKFPIMMRLLRGMKYNEDLNLLTDLNNKLLEIHQCHTEEEKPKPKKRNSTTTKKTSKSVDGVNFQNLPAVQQQNPKITNQKKALSSINERMNKEGQEDDGQQPSSSLKFIQDKRKNAAPTPSEIAKSPKKQVKTYKRMKTSSKFIPSSSSSSETDMRVSTPLVKNSSNLKAPRNLSDSSISVDSSSNSRFVPSVQSSNSLYKLDSLRKEKRKSEKARVSARETFGSQSPESNKENRPPPASLAPKTTEQSDNELLAAAEESEELVMRGCKNCDRLMAELIFRSTRPFAEAQCASRMLHLEAAAIGDRDGGICNDAIYTAMKAMPIKMYEGTLDKKEERQEVKKVHEDEPTQLLKRQKASIENFNGEKFYIGDKIIIISEAQGSVKAVVYQKEGPQAGQLNDWSMSELQLFTMMSPKLLCKGVLMIHDLWNKQELSKIKLPRSDLHAYLTHADKTLAKGDCSSDQYELCHMAKERIAKQLSDYDKKVNAQQKMYADRLRELYLNENVVSLYETDKSLFIRCED